MEDERKKKKKNRGIKLLRVILEVGLSGHLYEWTLGRGRVGWSLILAVMFHWFSSSTSCSASLFCSSPAQ